MVKQVDIIHSNDSADDMSCSFIDFMESNWETLTLEELYSLNTLLVEDEFVMGVHYGYVTIKRTA